MMTAEPSPTRPSASKVATVGVQMEMSVDPRLEVMLVPVIGEVVPEYVDTESDVQSSRPELQESSGEDDELQESSSEDDGLTRLRVVKSEDHDERRRLDIEQIINDIQDLVDNTTKITGPTTTTRLTSTTRCKGQGDTVLGLTPEATTTTTTPTTETTTAFVNAKMSTLGCATARSGPGCYRIM